QKTSASLRLCVKLTRAMPKKSAWSVPSVDEKTRQPPGSVLSIGVIHAKLRITRLEARVVEWQTQWT
ncbi:MAG TPA: hypothetical protein PLZ60_03995, partial [Kiritimatiellia bacterium]|nr:hypothetical protein [Kiritimatiellia bacterium]